MTGQHREPDRMVAYVLAVVLILLVVGCLWGGLRLL